MTPTLDQDRRLVTLEFESAEELEQYLERSRGYGMTVRLEEHLEEGEVYRLVLRAARSERAAEAKIKQIFRSGVDLWGTVFEPADWAALDPRPACDSPPASGAPQPATDASGNEGEIRPLAPRSKVRDETRASAPVFDIRQMNPNERMRLASRANRQERQVLLRDGSPQVLMNLLNNPGIETKEVLELVKNPQVSAGILRRISQERRYTGNYEIQIALVRNPKTPTPIAVRMVDLLRVNDLRDLAKSQAVREEVKQAALRRYLQRSQ